MSILLVGLNHRTAPFMLRERLALSGAALHTALMELGCPPLDEVVILSTCNRLEIYAVSKSESSTQLEDFITRLGNLAQDTLRPHLYILENDSAIHHLMRVASGLESQILGETQILGQVVRALESAQAADTSGAILSRLFAQAVHAGKRARRETAISSHTTSVSHSAAGLVPDHARVLIVGAGEMATLAALALDSHPITVINRTYEHAAALAQRVGGQALEWAQLGEVLTEVDVVISAINAPQIAIHTADVARPMLLIDIALPRTIDPAVRDLPSIEYYALDDLQALVDTHLAQRRAAVPQVEAII